MASEQLFALSQRFSAAVEIINKVDPKRLGLILQRIIVKLHLQRPEAFSEEESERLLEVLNLNSFELKDLVEISSFIYEQAAYVQLTLPQMKEQLEKAGLQTDQNRSFLKVWEANAPELISGLKSRSVVPKRLESTHWRLHLQTGQSELARVKVPTAIFHFNLHDQNSAQTNDSFVCEFQKEDLYKFYENLEMIQEQLDQLS
mmetsp:Transcript_161/g.267  ORF Transcript_161/g.267 Transcript_161/m.267 type:complete len:202 (+) Transcript_161:139-744(+)|eukprot:CAMPEP_0201477944 /NCGR_PEP_ID=MMETSP0151_2-20130828/2882_1 /ASSEMBLY_ACC=CAM_ASM_000257 /TAXON_ID=200890 /ORGANISM="Paramoeba atlantica, Strain 621/1 / CCAP 1560/9" /LENGTH=201 /DNA_ID=CAMNT_0047858833 /DNA_START=136 /DNA_END=741 /DNA_ORIENTATION=-